MRASTNSFREMAHSHSTPLDVEMPSTHNFFGLAFSKIQLLREVSEPGFLPRNHHGTPGLSTGSLEQGNKVTVVTQPV